VRKERRSTRGENVELFFVEYKMSKLIDKSAHVRPLLEILEKGGWRRRRGRGRRKQLCAICSREGQGRLCSLHVLGAGDGLIRQLHPRVHRGIVCNEKREERRERREDRG
jgi:hypothetical protein